MKRLAIFFYAAYLGLTIYFYYRWFTGLPSIQSMTTITTILGFGFALSHGASQFGWKKILVLLATCFLVALAFESIGVATGKIYGPYHYTNKLGPKFLGLVPYIIPLAWFMMMYPALVIAQNLLRSSQPRGIKMLWIAAVGGVVMTAWDLVMDPMMVSAKHWIWDGAASTRPYFGIPIQNFIGWWATTLITFLIFFFITVNYRSGGGRPEVRWPAVTYATVGASSVLSAYLSGLPGPALVGIMSMLPWVLAVLW
jgi:uncharacterized membrane protein